MLPDDPHHQRLPDNDAEIIDRAVYVGELTGRNVTIVAGDFGMLCRAAAVSLGAAHMPRRQRDVAPGSPGLAGQPAARRPSDEPTVTCPAVRAHRAYTDRQNRDFECQTRKAWHFPDYGR